MPGRPDGNRSTARRRLLTRGYGLLLLFLFPLACPGYAGLTAFKTRFFFISMGIFLVSLLAASVKDMGDPRKALGAFRRRLSSERSERSGHPGKHPGPHPRRSEGTGGRIPGGSGNDASPAFASAALLLWLGLALISGLASPFGSDVWLGQGRGGGLPALLLYAALLFACQAWAQPGKAELWAAAAALLLLEIIALLQLNGGNPLGLYPNGWGYADHGLRYQGRFLSTLGNTGQLGAWFCLTVPALLAALCLEKGKARWLLLIPALAAVYLMLQAEMEGALLGLIMGLLLLGPWLLAKSRRQRRRLLLLLAALLILTLVFVYQYQGPAAGSLYQASQLLHGQAEDSFGSRRIGIWRAALARIRQRPWLGFGPDCFDRAYAALFQTDGMRVDAAHNEYLNMAVCLGLPAALAYMAALLRTILALVKGAAKNQRLLIFAAALLCYALQDFFNFSTPIAAPVFWAVWGMSLAALRGRAPG